MDRKKEHRREYFLKARIHSYRHKKLAPFYQDAHTYIRILGSICSSKKLSHYSRALIHKFHPNIYPQPKIQQSVLLAA